MYQSSVRSITEEVAAHYDHLDKFYREIWGEHVHHGLWETGEESPEEATLLLSHRMAKLARITAGDRVCDVGCGYGGTSRLLARDYGAEVLALTLSRQQYNYAEAQARQGDKVAYRCEDFIQSDLAPGSFQALLSIECIEHMPDKAAFFAKAYEILEAGGRFALAVWTSADSAAAWQKATLIEPICREGRMPSLPTAREWHTLIENAGYRLSVSEDVAAQVKKTWAICCQRLVKNLLTKSSYRKFLWSDPARDKVFALTLFRLLAAFETKAMQYWILAGDKP